MSKLIDRRGFGRVCAGLATVAVTTFARQTLAADLPPVDENGPQAQAVGPVPDHARRLMTTVKAYERATVRAALTGDRGDLVNALALNPLVPSHDLARKLVDALLPE